MPNTKISDESAATTLAGDELLLGVQSAANVKITIDQIIQKILGDLSWKKAVAVASTVDGTLATAFAAGQTIDGVTLVTGDRILLKNQTTASENGIYVVAASGAPARAADASTAAGIVNAAVYAAKGTTQADTLWVCTTDGPITVDTTGLVFVAGGGGGGGGGLTNFDENLDTSSPNSTVNAVRLRVIGGSTDADFVLRPKGSGALLRQNPDGTSTGGNKRGTYSTDFQAVRASASQVAAGVNSCIVAGSNNTASGTHSVAVGGWTNSSTNAYSTCVGGYSNNASADYSVIVGGYTNSASGTHTYIGGGGDNSAPSQYSCVPGGRGNVANGDYSSVLGAYGKAFGINGVHVQTSQSQTTDGDSQRMALVLRRPTTNATPATLGSNSSTATATNQLALQNNCAMTVNGLVVARQATTKDTKSWTFTASIKRGANAASTAMLASCTPVVVAEDSGATGWTISVTADTTYGCLKVGVTGEASKSILWVCSLDAVQVIS